MEDKSRIYALCGTLAVVALLVAILLFAALSYPPAERPRWDVDKSEVLLADEYVPMDRIIPSDIGVFYTTLRAPETVLDLVFRLLFE